MRRGARRPQSQALYTNATGASVVPKRRRAPRPSSDAFVDPKMKEAPMLVPWEAQWFRCGGGLGGPKPKEATTPMRRGALVVLKRGTPQRPRGGGLDDMKEEIAHALIRRGPRWSQTEGGPRAHVAQTSMTPE